MPNVPIDPDEAVRLYVDQKWSVREVADHLGCSYGRVYGVLRNRVVMRGRNGSRRVNPDRALVADVMRERIVTGDWKPNHKILSEQDIAKIFSVGVHIVRGAVADLRRSGYLRTVRAKGTYVRPRRDWPEGGEAR